MSADGISSHRHIERYACTPKVLLAAKSEAELVQFKQGYKANRLDMPVHKILIRFWDLVTCRVASDISIFAIKLQPAAANWILLQGTPNNNSEKDSEKLRRGSNQGRHLR